MSGTTRDEKIGAEAGGGRTLPSPRLALVGLSLSVLLPSLGTSIANVGLPTLTEAFAVSFQEVQWVVLAYLLTMTTLIVSVGRLADITGRPRLLLAGILLFATASLLSGIAPTFGALLAARAVQGLAAAAMLSLAMALAAETFPKERTGSAIGLLGSMSAIGTALGPSLGGILIAAFGWRAIFLVCVPLALLAYLLAARHLPTDKRAQERDDPGFDIAGSFWLALTLAAYALAMTLGRGSVGSANITLLLAAATGAAIFVLVERRAAAPLIPPATLRDPSLRASLAMSALVSTVMMATLVVGPFYLSRALGLEAAAVGLAVSIGPLIAALSAAPAGRLVDRLGTQRTTVGGLVGILSGSAALAIGSAGFGIVGYLAPVAVITASYALFQTANNTAVMIGIPPTRRGVVSGMLNLSRNIGLITGTSVMGAVFSLASSAAESPPAARDAADIGLQATFAVAAMLIAVALAANAAVRSPVPRPAGQSEAS